MAKSGTASRVSPEPSGRSAETRRQLVEAAIETLKDHGFSGASARVIADRAGVNQGLVFYHFGSVVNLLLAALDAVSANRMEQYGAAVEAATTPQGLVEVATAVFTEDLDAGYVTVLVEMIAGASSVPGLGPEVAARMAPWFSFAKDAIDKTVGDSPLGSLVPSADAAYGVVALYLGLEMLTHLEGDRTPALNLFAHAQQLAGLLGSFAPPPQPKETP
jgi:AcrR family transcriptional regulator